MNRDQQKAMFAGKKKDANSNRIAYDIFLHDNVKKRLPKNWKYSDFRKYVTKVADNPNSYSKKQLEDTYNFNQFVINHYNQNNWILRTKNSPESNAVHVGSRVSHLQNQQFKLFFAVKPKGKKQ